MIRTAFLALILAGCAKPQLVDFNENRVVVEVNRFEQDTASVDAEAQRGCEKFGKDATFEARRWRWGDLFEHIYSCS